jgi:vacuolar-type H+-ATPase subunit F/Vma7
MTYFEKILEKLTPHRKVGVIGVTKQVASHIEASSTKVQVLPRLEPNAT